MNQMMFIKYLTTIKMHLSNAQINTVWKNRHWCSSLRSHKN